MNVLAADLRGLREKHAAPYSDEDLGFLCFCFLDPERYLAAFDPTSNARVSERCAVRFATLFTKAPIAFLGLLSDMAHLFDVRMKSPVVYAAMVLEMDCPRNRASSPNLRGLWQMTSLESASLLNGAGTAPKVTPKVMEKARRIVRDIIPLV